MSSSPPVRALHHGPPLWPGLADMDGAFRPSPWVSMRVTMLGTGAATASADRQTSAVLVDTGQARVLFDCGDGTLPQLLRTGCPTTLDAVCLTHAHLDHIAGILGLLRHHALRGHATPLPILGRPETLDTVAALLRIDPDIERVARLTPLRPGERFDLSGAGGTLRPFATAHRVPSQGYRLSLPTRPGTLDVERATALGLPPGPAYGALKRGEPVQAPNGTWITPADVIGPATPGASLAYTGDTMGTEAVAAAVRHVDLLIHDATFRQEDLGRAVAHHHATALEAGTVAAAARVGQLVLTHLSHRYSPAELDALRDEAASVYGGPVHLAADGACYNVGRPLTPMPGTPNPIPVRRP